MPLLEIGDHINSSSLKKNSFSLIKFVLYFQNMILNLIELAQKYLVHLSKFKITWKNKNVNRYTIKIK